MSDICALETKTDREMLQELVDYIKLKAPNIITGEHIYIGDSYLYVTDDKGMFFFKMDGIEINICSNSIQIQTPNSYFSADIKEFISRYKKIIAPKLKKMQKEVIENKKLKIKELEKELEQLKT